ncbi:hypothetical protein LIER_27786 [Lithospermum erythrorhizon]|uniref:Reverse transcriptase Ty1/copia-type domain-containing protein n=1 Tax=Lithospermum erythrorhizon TaxID=34254 RepID=A0AAV3RJA5_LITER
MNKELKALEDTATWKYKARLVAKGYTQVEGEDYNESFSPMAKVVIVRLLFALTAAKGWKVHHMDVNNAFLHETLDEVIYMKPPQGLKLQLQKQL